MPGGYGRGAPFAKTGCVYMHVRAVTVSLQPSLHTFSKISPDHDLNNQSTKAPSYGSYGGGRGLSAGAGKQTTHLHPCPMHANL